MSLPQEKIQHFKERLEAEKAELQEDLATLGQINPDNPKDWEAVQADLNVMQTDSNEVADVFEEFEGDTAILKELETRLMEVKHALAKIAGTSDQEYGVGEVSGEEIPEERLEINPAARETVEHVNEVEPIHAE